MYEQYGAAALVTAMELADEAGTYNAAALDTLLAAPQARGTTLPLRLPGLPPQTEVDRVLRLYETWVQIDEAQLDDSGTSAAATRLEVVL